MRVARVRVGVRVLQQENIVPNLGMFRGCCQ